MAAASWGSLALELGASKKEMLAEEYAGNKSEKKRLRICNSCLTAYPWKRLERTYVSLSSDEWWRDTFAEPDGILDKDGNQLWDCAAFFISYPCVAKRDNIIEREAAQKAMGKRNKHHTDRSKTFFAVMLFAAGVYNEEDAKNQLQTIVKCKRRRGDVPRDNKEWLTCGSCAGVLCKEDCPHICEGPW